MLVTEMPFLIFAVMLKLKYIMADCGKEYPQTAGRKEKYIGFPIPLTTMRMSLLASKLG